jgi:N-acetylneuraminic acid mutarotase
MIIWGGYSYSYLSNGHRYDPATNTWTAMSNTNAPSNTIAPSSRRYASAVWTDSEMIIWGGFNGGNLNDNRSYDSAADNWVRYEEEGILLSARYGHSAVWTGSEMIIWGGINTSALSDGARYDIGYRDTLFLYVDPSALKFRP